MGEFTQGESGWSYLRRRLLLWAVIAAVFTAAAVQHSFSRGRLAGEIDFDDVGYFNDGLRRLDLLYDEGVVAFVENYECQPPHSPFSSLLALASFAVFGIHDWAPYAGNGILILFLVALLDGLLRDVSSWLR